VPFGDERTSPWGWLIGLVPAAVLLVAGYALTESQGLRVLGAIVAALVLRVVAYVSAPRLRRRGP